MRHKVAAPLTRMDWVDGLTLDLYIDHLIADGEPRQLRKLADDGPSL